MPRIIGISAAPRDEIYPHDLLYNYKSFGLADVQHTTHWHVDDLVVEILPGPVNNVGRRTFAGVDFKDVEYWVPLQPHKCGVQCCCPCRM